MGVGCLMLGVDDVSFGVLGVDEKIRWLIKIIYKYELVFYMLFTVFK